MRAAGGAKLVWRVLDLDTHLDVRDGMCARFKRDGAAFMASSWCCAAEAPAMVK